MVTSEPPSFGEHGAGGGGEIVDECHVRALLWVRY